MQEYQHVIDEEKIGTFTIYLQSCLNDLYKEMKDTEYPVLSINYYIDSLVPYFNTFDVDSLEEFLEKLNTNDEFRQTFEISASTTTNVNNLFKIVKKMIADENN